MPEVDLMALNLKILYIVKHMPCPPVTGALLRVLNIGRQLKKCGHVTMVYVGRGFPAGSLEATRYEFGDVIIMKPEPYKGRGVAEWLCYKFSKHRPLYCTNKVSDANRKRFLQLRSEHDVVWFNTLPVADYFKIHRFSQSIMDLDDLNQLKFGQKVKLDVGSKQKISSKLSAIKWQWREKQALNRFSFVTVCSLADKKRLGGRSRTHVIPNGFEHTGVKPIGRKPKYMRLGFIGYLDYGPNYDGLKWFGERVWPLITHDIPRARLRIVGQVSKKTDFLNHPGFELLGFLQNPADEFANWSGMIVPLRYGGGTRLKIIEAFSRKCPVVATPIGAYGLEAEQGKNILLAQKPEAFAKACIRLLKDVDYGKQLANAAWDTFEKEYTWAVIGRAIKKVVFECATLNEGNSSKHESIKIPVV